jgi:hypothetical protein
MDRPTGGIKSHKPLALIAHPLQASSHEKQTQMPKIASTYFLLQKHLSTKIGQLTSMASEQA